VPIHGPIGLMAWRPKKRTTKLLVSGILPLENWGNNICKQFGDGSAAITQSSPNGCPIGSHSWADSWGNKICQSDGGGMNYYDTRRGCPIGFAPWRDNWGNPVCRRM
jgi:hypothetical protein